MDNILQFEDLNSDLGWLISNKSSFAVVGLSGKMSEAVELIEKAIERNNLTCRIYTSGRSAAAGGTLFGGVTGVVGILSAIGIAAHNIATYDPDYEIAKHIVDNKLVIEFKK